MAGLSDKWRLLLKITADPALLRADNAVAAVLLDLTGAEGFAWPSLPTLAARTNQSKRTVTRSIARLTRSGYFTVTASRGRGNSKTYRPNFAAIEDGSPADPVPSEKGVTGGTLSDQEKVPSQTLKGVTGGTPLHLRTQEGSEGLRKPSAPRGSQNGFNHHDGHKAVYDLGKAILGGKRAGGMVAKLLRHTGGDSERTLDLLRLAEAKADPRGYLGAVLRGDGDARADDVLADTERLYREIGVS